MTTGGGPAAAPGFALEARADLDALRSRYATTGRVHVGEVLHKGGAHWLRDALATSQSWRLIFNRGDLLYELDQAAQREAGEDKLQLLQQAVHREGRHAFQYLYESIRAAEPGEAVSHDVPALEAFAAFLNSPPFLAFARRLTGDDGIQYVDCQATRYRTGHFLNVHDDAVAGKDRVAAYVLNLSTAPWQPHWGGQLQFLGADGHVAEAFVPTFNALNVLRVPQPHLVSAVTPMADPAAMRLSITGWLRRAGPERIPTGSASRRAGSP